MRKLGLILGFAFCAVILVPAVSDAQESAPVFDVHMHAVPPKFFERASEANFGAHRKTATGMVTDPAKLLARTLEEMDKNHIRWGLLSGDNSMVQEWAQRHPRRFLPSFIPDLSAKDQGQAVSQFAKEVAEKRWRALGELGLPYAGKRLNDPILFPYYEICERAGIPVFFHTGLDGPDPQRLVSPAFRVELGDPLLLQDVVIRFPKLKIVIMHMGWPFFDHALYMLYAYPNVLVDVAVVDWILGKAVFERMLREAIDTVGSDRILFGSDQMVWPQMITPAVASIRDSKLLSEADKRSILWNNAAALFGIPSTQSRWQQRPARRQIRPLR
jgi:predicted TIM-barrel fold metal-dependent hydrolase